MILRTQIGGFLPSPPKPEDRLFSQVLLPTLSVASGDVDLEEFCTPISDQLRLDSCVANAAADSVECCNGVDGLEQIDVSRLKIYYDGRSVMTLDGKVNESYHDQGMWIRAAFQAMNVFGVCPESMWPYDSTKVNVRPDLAATWYALKHKLHSYYRINSVKEAQLDEIRSAIQGKHPPVFGIPVTEAFYKGSLDVIPPPKPGENTLGYHGIMAMGTIGEDIRIRNSWGIGWSSNGYAKLHPDWFNLGFVIDPWVPTNGLTLEKP